VERKDTTTGPRTTGPHGRGSTKIVLLTELSEREKQKARAEFASLLNRYPIVATRNVEPLTSLRGVEIP
jgi:hypothetical protein